MRVLQARTKRPLDLLAVGAGGRVAAACSLFGVRGVIDVWDAATGQPVLTRGVDEHRVNALAFTPDGRHVAVSAGGPVLLLDATTGEARQLLTPALGDPAFALSPDGARLLTTSVTNQAGEVELWEANPDLSFRRLWRDGLHEYSWFAEPAVGPDGVWVAVARHDGFGDRVRNAVEIRDPAAGRVLAEIEFGAADPLEEVVFSADGSKVLARSSGRAVKVFDAATGQPVGELSHPGRPYVTGVAVHPNGTVACSRNSGAVCLWNLEKCEPIRALDWRLGKLVSVAFAPDGSIGAAGTEDGRVVVWDAD